MDAAMSLELGPKGLLVFEDYAKGNTSSSHLPQRKGIPGLSIFSSAPNGFETTRITSVHVA